MTQDKMRKVIAACVSAATVLLVTLLSVLIYQWVTIAVLNKRIKTVETEIAQLEEVVDMKKMDLEYYQSELCLSQKLIELQKLRDQQK